MTRPAFFKYTNSIVTKGATEIARNWFFDVVVDDEEESLGCTISSGGGPVSFLNPEKFSRLHRSMVQTGHGRVLGHLPHCAKHSRWFL